MAPTRRMCARTQNATSTYSAGINKTFGNIGVDVNLGGNARYARNDYNSVTVQDFVQPGLYTVANGRIKNPIYQSGRKENQLAVRSGYHFLQGFSVPERHRPKRLVLDAGSRKPQHSVPIRYG